MHIRKFLPFPPLDLERPREPIAERQPIRRGSPRGREPADEAAEQPSKLEPTLVSSVVGELERVLFAWPDKIFEVNANANLEAQRQQSLRQIETMLETLPSACEIAVVHGPQNGAAVLALFAKHRPNAKPQLVLHADPFTIWVQDPAVAIVGSAAVEALDFFQKQQVALMRAALPQLGVDLRKGGIDLEGGNTLSGKEHWFVGADMLRSMIQYQSETEVAAARRHCTAFENPRTPVIIRSAILPVPSLTTDANGDQIHFQNRPGTEQPLVHIDLFMAIARDDKDREVILVGSPRDARQLMGDGNWPEQAGLEAHLESIAVTLEAEGFPVRRVPMPMFAVELPNKKKGWRFASYTNVLVQDANTKTVWLPTFGSDLWPEVRMIDDANAAAWCELGYRVVRIPDCTNLADKGGGVHCMLLTLERGL